jgi:hypothetical protein
MTTSDALQHYARHDPLTHPAGLASLFDALPSGAAALCSVLSGLIVHTSWADKYAIPAGTPLPRDTKPVATRLAEIMERFEGPLATRRAPMQRAFGTCRDFALLICSALRHRGIPARVRCGFATYFAGRRFDDHWICEDWVADEERWAMADAQIDLLQREQLDITFDTADLPAGAYLDAASAWALVRSGQADAEAFGHGDTRGLWFMSVDLHRDLLALANCHMSAWDTWRTAGEGQRKLGPDDLARCDLMSAAVIEYTASGDFAALQDLASRHLLPPWQQDAPAGGQITSRWTTESVGTNS